MSDQIPRRFNQSLFTPAEKLITDSMLEIEKLPADERLTEAVDLLQKAKDKVADYVDCQ